ncbi:carboxymuconolactone decarboxylase family protein [Pontimicrobium sp. SW4]|uniref:Carboxymuconolactone decarboxylase family protein n=1 Tax=Pontimicrobium sp. SW4 TaxID=3153519 RepID=A0AAU7BPG2_9FLAO
MKEIHVPTRDQVDNKSKVIFDNIKSKIGMLPNIYAVTGYSSDSLELHMETTNRAGKGSFSMKELEAIRLVVSEVNGCDYCLAAHTAIAKMNGFNDEDAIALRTLNSSNEKLLVLTTLAADIVENRGKPLESNIDKFFDLGYTEKALIDMVSVIVDITFTNYIHGITRVPIDFPEVVSV